MSIAEKAMRMKRADQRTWGNGLWAVRHRTQTHDISGDLLPVHASEQYREGRLLVWAHRSMNSTQHLNARDLGKDDVQQDAVRMKLREDVDGLQAIVGEGCLVALLRQ